MSIGLTITRFSKEIGLDRKTVRRRIASGEIMASVVMGRFRIPQSEVKRLTGRAPLCPACGLPTDRGEAVGA